MDELKYWRYNYEQGKSVEVIKCISDTLPDKFLARIVNKLKKKRGNSNEAQLEGK